MLGSGARAAVRPDRDPGALRKRLLGVADEILDNANISYVYGGSAMGSEAQCQACNTCLGERNPSPKQRLVACPSCRSCSLDCSHFVQEVFRQAGVRVPYLNTELMLGLSPEALLDRYGYRVIETGPETWRAGDLLVYQGHVVILEKNHGQGYGSIVHATGGKDVKGPGQGVQRETLAPLVGFRGPLLRVLRHDSLWEGAVARAATAPAASPALTPTATPALVKPAPAPAARGKRLRPIIPKSER